jgi:hypothetical protein
MYCDNSSVIIFATLYEINEQKITHHSSWGFVVGQYPIFGETL